MKKPMSYYKSIKDQMLAKENKFKMSCAQGVQHVKTFLDEKYKMTQQVLTDIDIHCASLKIDVNRNQTHVQKSLSKVHEMQKSIEIKKFALELQQNDIQLAKELNEILLKGKQSMQLKHRNLINKKNDKKMRMDKVDEFIKNCQTPNQSIMQTGYKRLYTPKNNQDFELGIKFRPESRELIARVETFDRKIAEFILFFDEQEKRYCLKNPFKNLKSTDLLAVKNFNIHNDEVRLYEELTAIVVKYIDNSDDEMFKF